MQRFWDKIKKTDGCWEWTGRLHHGYGRFRFNGRSENAHRVSFMLTHGRIPDGLYILHKCDNRKCVRPDHLFPGTHKDNMNDRDQKGRCARGEKSGKAILTEEKVKEIRAKYIPYKVTMPMLAKEYGVSYSAVHKIIFRESWTHI